MSQTSAHGRRVTYRRRGRQWVDARASDANQWTGASWAGGLLALGSVTQPPAAPQAQSPLPAPQQSIGAVPSVSAVDGSIRLEPRADNSGVGLNYYYTKNGVAVFASGIVTMHTPHVKCVLTFKNGSVDSAGISIEGSAGVKLHLDARSATTTFVNMHVKHWAPVDFAIPLGGPVPLSLAFATMFDVNSGFSAKSSQINADGEYDFGGRIWAGRAGGRWSIATGDKPSTVTDFTQSISNLSMGISSFAMAFSIRALVGLGAFGANVGVYAAVRFGGSLLGSPSEAFTCRQGTLDVYLDSGLGWQVPGWVATAINFFLKPLTGTAIDAAGDIAPAKPASILHYNGQSPGGCASPAKKT